MKTFALNTAAKVQIGKTASLFIRASRKLIGKSANDVTVRRGKITWHLDLREGIDLSIFLFGKFELETSNCIDRILKSGDGFLDIGANVGAHTVRAGMRVGSNGQVVAVEPTDWAMAKLKKNLSLNPDLLGHVEVVKGFVSSVGTAVPEKICSSWSFVEVPNHTVHKGMEKTTTGTAAVSLDELILKFKNKKIGLIKIDVDGFEIDVLKSGLRELKKVLPPILIEFAPYCLVEKGKDPKEMIKLIQEIGYKTVQTPNGRALDFNYAKILDMVPNRGGVNLLFI